MFAHRELFDVGASDSGISAHEGSLSAFNDGSSADDKVADAHARKVVHW